MERYICIKDLQGTGFALDYVGTLKEWRELAMSWAYGDDRISLYNELKYYKIKNSELLDFIQDFWELEIVEYKEDEITEWCDCCGQETRIKNTGGYCKYCGKWLKPCSLCDIDKVKCINC